jgi:hypothetical protein
VILGGFLGAATPLLGQAPPLGSEFPVNTYTTGLQQSPSVAVVPDGRFVVVWGSYDQDGSKYGIFGQRYDSLGQRVGTEFPVNMYTTGNQRYPSVGADDAGAFVVVWASKDQDGSDYGIFAQRFDGSGAKAGGEFRVNTYTSNIQSHPKIAVNGDGSFVVVWNDNDRDLSSFAVTGQRFAASGVKVGSDFQVNTYTGNKQIYPSIAADPAGNFVVVWQSLLQDGDSYGIFGQRFDRSGTKIGPEFAVNTDTLGSETSAEVATDPHGNFVVVWASRPTFGGKYGILAQRFNSGSEKLGSEITVTESITTIDFKNPTVTVGPRGDFLVAWQGYATGGTVQPEGIFGQQYDRTGLPWGFIFQVNAETGYHGYPVLASDAAGNFDVVWNFQDGPSTGVFGRRTSFAPDSLSVDSYAGKIATSDVNGVLEPGETVFVVPSWKNVTGEGPLPTGVALTGTGDGIGQIGGGAPSYNLDDGTADYGLSLPGESNNCFDGTTGHNCYRVSLGAEDHTGIHQDLFFRENLSSGGYKFWRLHVGESFSDVPRSQPFYKKIETLFHDGITTGCNATAYCPGDVVSRGQMAIFIARGIAGAGENVPTTGLVSGSAYDCSPGGHSLFTDVAPTDSFCKHAHYIGAQNVTLGCSASQYCPSDTVTRDTMASFIAKALVVPRGGTAVPASYTDGTTGRSYSCVSGSPNLHFTDVPVTSPFCKHIHYLWARGIVVGCTATAYCPSSPVARDAMAKFLANGFNVQLYGP